MPSYNIVLDSTNKASGFNDNATYYFDWSVLPDCKYKVNFNYSGSVNTITANDRAEVFCDLGQTKCFTTSSTQVAAIATKYLGSIFPFTLSSSSFLYAWYETNPPIYLDNRPNNNVFNVQVLNSSGQVWVDNSALSTFVSVQGTHSITDIAYNESYGTLVEDLFYPLTTNGTQMACGQATGSGYNGDQLTNVSVGDIVLVDTSTYANNGITIPAGTVVQTITQQNLKIYNNATAYPTDVITLNNSITGTASADQWYNHGTNYCALKFTKASVITLSAGIAPAYYPYISIQANATYGLPAVPNGQFTINGTTLTILSSTYMPTKVMTNANIQFLIDAPNSNYVLTLNLETLP